ncbi:MAG: RNA repair transcriptional activator RtcR family protein, partial [Planctomycetota bacterium]
MDRPSGHTVISFLGTQLDRGGRHDRWDHWRPNVAMCMHEDLFVERLVLLTERRFGKLYNIVEKDIASVSPDTVVEKREIGLRDPWDFEEVFDMLLSQSHALALDPESADVLVHMTTGTHVAQICLFLLTETRHFPAR